MITNIPQLYTTDKSESYHVVLSFATHQDIHKYNHTSPTLHNITNTTHTFDLGADVVQRLVRVLHQVVPA